ncbi:MAG: FAD-binding and (Fe-S)-binding domain-containing protein [Vicinamibacteria bacterium]
MTTTQPAEAGAERGLRDALVAAVGSENLLERTLDRVAYASDASFYRLVPRAVLRPRGVDDVRALFRVSHEHGLPLTFRAAGTSLSGQAVSDGLLVDVSRHLRALRVEQGGRRVRVEPGVVAGQVNARLRPHGAKLGPDPASLAACMMGGVLANNSSGMCCGVEQNAYHTLESIRFLLPSGTLIDSAEASADEQLRGREPSLHAGLVELRERVLAQPALLERIRAKYRMKNTVGYSLNALVDFERPVEILAHLLIGSEGTLAFIAEAVLRTLPDLPAKATGLLSFADVQQACAAIVPLREAGAAALELMDRAALRSVEAQPGMPASIRELPARAAALLLELQAPDAAALGELERAATPVLETLPLLRPAPLTREASEQAGLWRVRSGMFPSVGAARRSGTSVIIEDVAYPLPALAEASLALSGLFARHGYPEGIVFGHAKDGNLHFVITQSFHDQAEIDRYRRLMDDVVELTLRRFDGSLKGEHGTGRNMAPFVEAEWGADAYALMQRIKRLCDPRGLLNPGVILNPDPLAHLRDLKPLPSVEPEVDACIECGYCEPRCPSRDLTLTPRQRIVVRRERTRLAAAGERAAAEALDRAYAYDGLDTCAVDGLCATACPVSIDTGKLVKRLRGEARGPFARRLAGAVARHFALAEAGVRAALRVGGAATALGLGRALSWLTRLKRACLGHEFPLWIPPMPRAARRLPRGAAGPQEAAAVYVPACLTRAMGALPGEPDAPSLPEALVALASRAGRPLWIPPDVAGTCCGVPFSSKGFPEAHALTAGRMVERLLAWSQDARLPVVLDVTPCVHGLLTSGPSLTPELRAGLERLRILDSSQFLAELLPLLPVRRRVARAAVHPVCSAQKLGLQPTIEGVARACAEEVLVPASAGCCGFAGDRGLLVPELTESALRAEAAEISTLPADTACVSTSRGCEIGLTRATGRPFRSLAQLLEEVTRPRASR